MLVNKSNGDTTLVTDILEFHRGETPESDDSRAFSLSWQFMIPLNKALSRDTRR